MIRRAMPALVFGVVLAVLATAIAGAFVVTPESKTVTVQPGSVPTDATAKCSHLEYPLLAGFHTDLDGNPMAGSGVALIGFKAKGEDLVTSGANFGTNAGDLKSTAYCGKIKGGLTQVSQGVSADTPGVLSVHAKCPKGLHVVYGAAEGGLGLDGQGVAPEKLWSPSPRTIKVRGIGSGDPTARLRAFAYCGNVPPYEERAVGHAPVDAHSESAPVEATCPAGTKALFGGFQADPAGTAAPGSNLFPTGLSRPSADTIEVTGTNIGSSESSLLKALAYCR
jgi:hypothetical protein